MRKFKPAPKQASANRIRERYLHQLGLQRGAASSSQQQHWDDHHNNNHVVVISGLPSLPEDRATNDNVLESHDFSHADGSYISCYGDEGSCSGGGNKHQSAAIAIGPPQHLYQPYPPQGDSSHCSRSTLSTSPHANNTHHLGNMADENMTSMALACPHSLLKSSGGGHVNNNGTTNNTTTTNNSSSSALPFSLSWGTSQLSRSAAVLLDEAGGSSPSSSSAPIQRPSNDHDSVSSAATATTAESSFTATMVSRDWGASGGATNNIVAIPHHPPSGTASVSSMGDSVTSAPGVFFQARGPSSNYASTGPAHCVATSSLASALNRFNIDSDCEASVASNSIIDDPTMMMDDCHIDDSASCASHMSGGSSISIASTSNTNNKPRTATKKKKKKIGKNQRLLDRASAHERMMQMRNDRSQKLRAGMVHSQRASHCSLGGLPMPHQLGGGGGVAVASSPARSCSSSVVSQASSIPLMHVDHQATPMSTPVAALCNIGDPNNNMVMMMQGSPYLSPVLPKRPSFGGSDLGRTPTASNCSQQHTKTTLPAGVHYLQGANCGPLNYHPQLVSKIYMPPPPNVMAMSPPPSASLPSWNNTDRRDDSQSNSSQVSEMETNLANVVSSMQHSTQEHAVPPSPPSIVKRAAESVEDDVMEVAVTLSMLGGRTTPSNGGGGMIPRVR